MSRIEIEITKDNHGLKKGMKSKIDSVYAKRMVDDGFAKYVNKDESEAMKKAESGVKKHSDDAKRADDKKSSKPKAKSKVIVESKDVDSKTDDKKKPSKAKK